MHEHTDTDNGLCCSALDPLAFEERGSPRRGTPRSVSSPDYKCRPGGATGVFGEDPPRKKDSWAGLVSCGMGKTRRSFVCAGVLVLARGGEEALDGTMARGALVWAFSGFSRRKKNQGGLMCSRRSTDWGHSYGCCFFVLGWDLE